MSTISVQAQRIERKAAAVDLELDLERVRTLANAMDAQFEIAGFKLGWDAIIGLVPVVGDVVSAAIAVYPIHVANKHSLGKTLQARMAANVLIDWAIGIVPLVGDLFDVGWKANLRNHKLLERAAAKRPKSDLIR
jgi:hypothetical protein